MPNTAALRRLASTRLVIASARPAIAAQSRRVQRGVEQFQPGGGGRKYADLARGKLVGLAAAPDRDRQALADLDRAAPQLVALTHGGDRGVIPLRDREQGLTRLHAVDDAR